jgi:homoserine O-acetyltransferase/O-succinyltransferase
VRRTAWLFGLLCCLAAPLPAVNFADDLVNPPELGILEQEIARVPKGRAVVTPFSEETRGHGSHTGAGLWKHLLAELPAASDRRSR